MEDDEIEFTLLNKRDVLVYQIPPASSSSGHKADDWKTCIWRGRCRVAGRGKDLTIKMIDASTDKLFAQCLIPNGDHEKYVERVVDSSRYFVLKITNGARHAFIGMGFEDRNDAFDFTSSLIDFKSTWIDRDKVDVSAPVATGGPAKDLSLKEGQKITINLKGIGEGDGRRRKEKQSEAVGGFAGLAPPPSAGGSRRQAAAATPAPLQPPAAPAPAPAPVQQRAAAPAMTALAAATQAAPAPQAQDDFFGDGFDDFQSAGAAQAATPAQDNLAAQFGQLDLGGQASGFGAAPAQVPAQVPVPAPQQMAPAPQSMAPTPAPALAAPQSSDPFAGFVGAQLPTTSASQAPAPALAPKPAAAQKRDPFDEFDIFK